MQERMFKGRGSVSPHTSPFHPYLLRPKDVDEVRRTLYNTWNDSEGATGILERLQEGTENLYRFEEMLESH